jgi:hypothetical protein
MEGKTAEGSEEQWERKVLQKAVGKAVQLELDANKIGQVRWIQYSEHSATFLMSFFE